jgi:Transthyretin-like family.
MRAWIFLSVALLVGCASLSSESRPLVFRGVVQTVEGKPVSNVRVTLYEDLTSWSWNPANWYLRPDRKIAETRTDKSGRFVLSTSENISRRKLKIVAERVKRLMPGEDPNNPASIRTPDPIKRPDSEKLNRIVVPDGFVPEP